MTGEPSKQSRIDVFKKPGASRAVASASWTMLMAIIGAIMLFVYQIYAGNVYGEEGGLSYWSVTGAIFALSTLISTGAGSAFLKIAKEGYTLDYQKGKHYAVQMAKINLLIGLISNIALFVLAFVVITDTVLFIMMIGAASAIMLVFSRDILMNMLGVVNRFDMASVVGGLYGVVVFGYGFIIIVLGLPPQWLAFGLTFMLLVMVSISIFFYNRIKSETGLSFKDLFLPSKKYPITRAFAKRYLKYGALTSVSNLVVFGIYSHIVLLMAFLCYNTWGPMLGLTTEITTLNMTQLLTLIDSFVFIEVALILFSGPVNVEIAEAYCKKDYACIESSINAVGKVGLMLALPISVAMMILARPLLLILAAGSVSTGGAVTEALLFQGWVTFAITGFGQAFYGLACLFGAALIGAGEAKQSAIGFGVGAILLFVTTPAFIFLFGFLGNLFPIGGVSTYSLIGTGLAFLVGGLFVLPFLARVSRRKLNIRYDFRLKRMLISMLLFAIFLVLAPIDLYATLLQGLIPLSFDLLQILSLITWVFFGFIFCIICYCFFGVAGKGDGQLLQDIFNSFGIGWLARWLRALGRFFYNLNPLNPH
ncbi:MAG: hypothetical protein ACTSRS_15505 [Candidatus Helarchaeota archaeon]